MEYASLGHTLKQQKLRHRHTKTSSDSQDLLHRRRQSAIDLDMDIARRKAAAWAWYQRGNVEIDPTRSTPVVMMAACRRRTSALASRFKAEAMSKDEVKENTPWNCGSSLYDSLDLQWFVHHLDGALEGQVMERDHLRSFSMPRDCSDNPLKQVKAIDQDSEEAKNRLKVGKAENRGSKDPSKEGKLMDARQEEQLCLVNRRPRSRSMSDYSAVMSMHPHSNGEGYGLEKSDEAASSAAAEGMVKRKRSKLPWPLRFIVKSFQRISRIRKDERVYHHLHHHYHYPHDQRPVQPKTVQTSLKVFHVRI